MLTAAGAVTVRAPRVNDRRVDPDSGERQRFSSAILPAWARKSPQISEVLPLLYLHGLSTSNFGPALEQFLGSGGRVVGHRRSPGSPASGKTKPRPSPPRDLSGTDYVYLWVDGVHFKVRLEQERLCLLVILGVRADGRKELVALADGYRESTESWADLLRDCRRRGMMPRCWPSATEPLASGKPSARCSRPLGSNAAGSTSRPMSLLRCRNQRTPGHWPPSRTSTTPRTSTRPKSRSKRSRSTTAPNTPRRSPRSSTTPTSCWTSTFPAEHWIHLRTTNPIESTFATVRLRTKVTKGPGSRAAGIAMAYKLIDAAQARWRAVNAPHLVALVRAGATFHKGKLLERPTDITPPQPADHTAATTGTEVA